MKFKIYTQSNKIVEAVHRMCDTVGMELGPRAYVDTLIVSPKILSLISINMADTSRYIIADPMTIIADPMTTLKIYAGRNYINVNYDIYCPDTHVIVAGINKEAKGMESPYHIYGWIYLEDQE